MSVRAMLIGLALAASSGAQHGSHLVVYGGTAAGVSTAVAGARQGSKIALLEPRHYIGGMVSGGLSGTDGGRREVIGGMALEFYYRAWLYYEVSRHLQEVTWMPEPKAAEAILREMMREVGVTLFLGAAVAVHGQAHVGLRQTGIYQQQGRHSMHQTDLPQRVDPQTLKEIT